MAIGSIISSIGGAAFDLFGPKAGKVERGQSIALAGQATAARYGAAGARLMAEGTRIGADADIFRAGAYREAAGGFEEAAGMSETSLAYSKRATEIRLLQAERELYKTIGGAEADVAGAGFAASGSALDILRDSAAQGALTREIIGVQGKIDADVYAQAARGFRMQASAERANAALAEFASEEKLRTAGTYDLSAEAQERQAETYSGLSALASDLASKAKKRQKVGGVIKGIAGILDLGMFAASGGLSSLFPSKPLMSGGTAP